MASAAHATSFLITALLPGRKGREEALEGSLLCLTTSLSGVLDIHFPTKLLGQPWFSVSFSKPAHQTSAFQRPGESQEELP